MIWKLLHWIGHLLFWILIAFILRALISGRDIPRAARVHSDGRIEFVPSWLGLCMWVLCEVWVPFMAIDYLRHGLGNPWEALIGASFGLGALAFLIELPATIVAGSDGLEQVYWFRRNKRIGWGEIVEINTGEKSRVVTITGADGTKIIHSRQLTDRPRLLLELKRHCGDNLPPDFPCEPIGGL